MQYQADFLGPARVFCVISEPEKQVTDIAVVVFNSGLLPNYGPFRLSNEIAQVANELGYLVARLDQSGKGESSARSGATRARALSLDYADVLEKLRTKGINRTLLVGLCSGADDALALATQQPDVAGVVLLDGPAIKNRGHWVRFFARKLLRKNSWLTLIKTIAGRTSVVVDPQQGMQIRGMSDSAEIVNGYRTLLERGGKVLAIFTGGGASYYNHQGQLASNIAPVINIDNMTETFLPDAYHIYPTLRERSQVLQCIRAWLADF